MPRLREKSQGRRAWAWGSPRPRQESDLMSWGGVGCSPWVSPGSGRRPLGCPGQTSSQSGGWSQQRTVLWVLTKFPRKLSCGGRWGVCCWNEARWGRQLESLKSCPHWVLLSYWESQLGYPQNALGRSPGNYCWTHQEIGVPLDSAGVFLLSHREVSCGAHSSCLAPGHTVYS